MGLLWVLAAAFGDRTANALAAPQNNIYYVNHSATGSATGLSWTDAFTNVQSALSAASSGDEIWVAAGLYKPGATRASTFQLKNGVGLYGGFAGSETAREQRDWQANVTVLSGDIDGNDGVDANGVVTDTANIAGNNAYHVVVGSGTDATALLDGFTLTAGQSNSGATPADRGGGMLNVSGSPSLVNVVFRGNDSGFAGGGMSNDTNSNPSLTNVIFSANSSVSEGGAMYNLDSSPVMTNVTFAANRANSGAGMFNFRSHPILTGATFSANVTDSPGGGMSNSASNPVLTNVAFLGNRASSGGGMLNSDASSPSLTNVIFSGNRANTFGGGIWNLGNSGGTLTNVTFSGNRAGVSAGGMYNEKGAVVIRNSIFWNNKDNSGLGTANASIVNSFSFTVVKISFSLLQGCKPEGVWQNNCGLNSGSNLADADPLFATPVDPATTPTVAGDLHLQAGSPVIDAGFNDVNSSETDLDGNPRLFGGSIDLGAYEYSPHVATSGMIYLPQLWK